MTSPMWNYRLTYTVVYPWLHHLAPELRNPDSRLPPFPVLLSSPSLFFSVIHSPHIRTCSTIPKWTTNEWQDRYIILRCICDVLPFNFFPECLKITARCVFIILTVVTSSRHLHVPCTSSISPFTWNQESKCLCDRKGFSNKSKCPNLYVPSSVAQGWFHKNWLCHRDVINETSVFSLRVHSCHAGSDVVSSPDLTLSRRRGSGDHWMFPWLCWVSSLNLMTTFLWCSDVWLARVNMLPISLACSELRQLTHPQWYPDPLPRTRLWSGTRLAVL